MRKITVPKPKLLKSGEYNIWLAKEKVSVTASTPLQCQERAMAIRLGIGQKKEDKIPTGMLTLEDVVREYIYSREGVISPSTLRGYTTIARTRFKNYMNKPVKDINWQRMISDEARIVSPKTVKNAWMLVSSSLRDKSIEFKDPKMPQTIIKDEPFLDYEQIKLFLSAIEGTSAEIGAILALHGLRRSELFAIKKNDIKNGKITVRGAVVQGIDGLQYKQTNKNDSSTRDVPVLITRLNELISDLPDDKPIVTCPINDLYKHINRICKKNNLPLVGVHGLRRSFASLCYHLGLNEMQTMKLGGWSNFATMRKIYTKLSQSDVDSGTAALKDFFANERTNERTE